MKGLHITIFVLAVFTLSAQSIHLTYMNYFYETSSVLDEFIDAEIKKSSSIDELLTKYRNNKVLISEYEKGKTDSELSRINRYNIEPYKTEQKLERAIKDWESKQESYHKLIVQWSLGLFVLLIGIVIYTKKWLWEGTAFMIAGIGEMLWWSSPSIRFSGAISEFERLLSTKLILSLLTLIIILAIWYFRDKKVTENSL